MVIKIGSVNLRGCAIPTRLRFQYRDGSLTRSPYVFAEVDLVVDGQHVRGVSSDFLAPEWFFKSTSATLDDDHRAMIEITQTAAERAVDIGPAGSVFELVCRLFDQQLEGAKQSGTPLLAAGFGVSLVERAIIDAFCRLTGMTFHTAVMRNAFQVNLGVLHPELGASTPSEFLPATPRRSLMVRHTVGLADPLDEEEPGPGDGLPLSLTANIDHYGLTHFKIKIRGDADHDLDRLERVFALLERRCRHGYAYSLDANEGFASAQSFKDFWSEFQNRFGRQVDRLLYVEQPIHRDAALGEETSDVFNGWQSRPEVIIDESDVDHTSVPRALECGYAGTSVKSCKGVLREIANVCLVRNVTKTPLSSRLVIAGEDLSTIGPISLMQDLSLAASLGLSHVERNGHHYFRGLSMFPANIQRAVVERHVDLYRWHDQEFATLRIDRGTISLESVLSAPFGTSLALNLDELETCPLTLLRADGTA